MAASNEYPQRAMTRHVGSERTGSREGLPTPGSFGGLENREEVIAKPATYLEVPDYLRASTPNAAPAGGSSLPAPARPTPRRVSGRRPPYLVMRDLVPERRRTGPQATDKRHSARTLVRIYLCAGLIVAFCAVIA